MRTITFPYNEDRFPIGGPMWLKNIAIEIHRQDFRFAAICWNDRQRMFSPPGGVDVEDDLAAVDDAVTRGLADPDRLGVGGWSYGGISTNYIIATTTRFKTATSGASIYNVMAGYGTDQYIRDYENELGFPWKNLEIWAHLPYPFLHADKIKTPTPFSCGQNDFNVPLLNTEQMYQALRSLDVPTELVIYPGQFHGF